MLRNIVGWPLGISKYRIKIYMGMQQIIIIILYSNTECKEYLKRRTMRLSLFRSPN